MDYETIEDALAAWRKKKYRTNTVDLQRSCVKLLEEAGELAKAILKGDKENALEECADVAIITAHICRGLGSKLFDEMISKFYVLEKRLETGVKEKK